ncbi:Crp/Fnr family transcriptional regulator [Bacillus sp. M6-12]|uniref:Crp/Fnr family transcriptional regulator n=1 Tax=Bacillus sp. M6-12 TaxID=2054166 RepID=UPI000C76B840|nr:Crp/Fnr family transcriptional regulator [Bacillus sp. M6-12]PLS15489.1 Crp/Fnr family transcriptional regulator [Bacillus sp. M6-12]
MLQSENSLSAPLQDLLHSLQHIRKAEKGAYLFQEGSVTNELYFLLSGKVQVSKIIPDGRELTLRICKEGDLVGELILFTEAPKYLMNAKVVEEAEVGVIFKNVLEEKLTVNNGLALEFMKWMSVQYRKSQTKFRDLVLHGKKGALYSTLIRLSNSYGVSTPSGIMIDLPLTNQELANFCGTSREVVNRLLSDLRKNNILSIDKGLITIFDLDFLKTEIDCENCPIELCNIE